MGTSLALPSPAHAAPSDNTTNAIFLADGRDSTIAETHFDLGNHALHLAGDIDGDGVDDIIVSDDAITFRVIRVADQTVIDTITMPASNNGAFVGDFDGDGTDELAVRTGNLFTLQNGTTVAYGRPADVPHIGDFDGDGIDTLSVRRGNVFHIKNTLLPGDADLAIPYGRPNDTVHLGDWDGDGRDTIMVRRGNLNYFKDSLEGGDADAVVPFGRISDALLVGDWTGSGAQTIGLIRPATSVPTQISPAVRDAASRGRNGLGTSPQPPRLQAGFLEEVVVPGAGLASDTALGGPVLSASRDQRMFVSATTTRGATEVQLQRSVPGEAGWTVIDRAPLDPTKSTGSAFLTAPATHRHGTATYRFVIPATATNAGVIGTPVAVSHHRAADLADTDRAAMISSVIAPYCGDIPVQTPPGDLVRVDGYPAAVGLTTHLGITRSDGASSQRLTSARLTFSERVYGAKTPSYFGVSKDGYSAYAALHECAHAVAREVLGDRYTQTLRDTYAGSSLTNPDEAIANALAQRWLENADGAITSPHLPTGDYQTYLEYLALMNLGSQRPRYPEAEILTFTGDDALVEYLSETARTTRLW